ncbi:MAG: type IV toxin-antitoxin system AbiEi family antitoxin domain-containing protein [Opitutaceae bacterium]|nr:type IV toxin-antitoxin system AbiEi family antitoxin domain-containing protein [Opitutaceae bacterium]
MLRPSDLERHGISRVQLGEAVETGLVQRAGRGLYRLAEAESVTENHVFAEVARRVPKGTFCLLSALRFHNLTTQNPHDAWVALPPGAWRPRLDFISLRIVHLSGERLTSGVETHDIEGVPVRVFSPAKTVADCFKFRNKIGLDVALEALRETWRERRATMDEITRFATTCRVANVMRPYLESLT